MFRRMLRAARLDPMLYAEVKDDPAATVQAGAILLLVSIALALPGVSTYLSDRNPVLVFLWSLLFNFTGWMLFALLAYLPMHYLVRREEGFLVYLRSVGFAQAPGVFNMLLSLGEFWALLANTIVLLWILACVIIAYSQTMRVSILAMFPLAVMGMFLGVLVRDMYSRILLGT
ncbi:MAG: hypothetical protein HYU30_05540 [Chloroflexi bacterium]|nr:hypothetical protein [Chloroflexota bacterium]